MWYQWSTRVKFLSIEEPFVLIPHCCYEPQWKDVNALDLLILGQKTIEKPYPISNLTLRCKSYYFHVILSNFILILTFLKYSYVSSLIFYSLFIFLLFLIGLLKCDVIISKKILIFRISLRWTLREVRPAKCLYVLYNTRSHPHIFITGDKLLLPLIHGLNFTEGFEHQEGHLEELLKLLGVKYLLLLILLVITPTTIALVIGHRNLLSHLTFRILRRTTSRHLSHPPPTLMYSILFSSSFCRNLLLIRQIPVSRGWLGKWLSVRCGVLSI